MFFKQSFNILLYILVVFLKVFQRNIIKAKSGGHCKKSDSVFFKCGFELRSNKYRVLLQRKRNKVDIKDIKERGMVRSIKSIRHRSRLLPLKYSKKLLNLGSLSGLCNRSAFSLEHFNICELSQSLNVCSKRKEERDYQHCFNYFPPLIKSSFSPCFCLLLIKYEWYHLLIKYE